MPSRAASAAKRGTYPQSTLLIVGHTDAEGEPAANEALSLERAEAMAAFLNDDVE